MGNTALRSVPFIAYSISIGCVAFIISRSSSRTRTRYYISLLWAHNNNNNYNGSTRWQRRRHPFSGRQRSFRDTRHFYFSLLVLPPPPTVLTVVRDSEHMYTHVQLPYTYTVRRRTPIIYIVHSNNNNNDT